MSYITLKQLQFLQDCGALAGLDPPNIVTIYLEVRRHLIREYSRVEKPLVFFLDSGEGNYIIIGDPVLKINELSKRIPSIWGDGIVQEIPFSTFQWERFVLGEMKTIPFMMFADCNRIKVCDMLKGDEGARMETVTVSYEYYRQVVHPEGKLLKNKLDFSF